MNDCSVGYFWSVHLLSEGGDKISPISVVAENADAAIKIAAEFAAVEECGKTFSFTSVARLFEINAISCGKFKAVATQPRTRRKQTSSGY